METNSLLVHVGYPKTGSSWIQRYLFQNPNARFAPLFGSDAKMRGAVEKFLIRPHDLIFDPDICSKHFYPAMLDVTNKGLVAVMSHERLSGNPHSGGYDSRELANRIAEVFPEEKVLIIIREQKSMIVSTYRQYVRNGGVCSLVNYLYPPCSDNRIPLFNFEHFKYHRLVRHYIDLFGSSNVLVLPYELFKDDPREFVSKIIRFAGAQDRANILERLPYSNRENTTPSGFSIAIKRPLNRIVARRDTVNLHAILSISRRQELALERFLEILGSLMPDSFQRTFDQKLKLAVSKMVDDRYEESNNLIAEMSGIDLEKYGYDLS